MSMARNYYEPKGLTRSASGFVINNSEFKVNQSALGKGVYGSIFTTREKVFKNTTPLVVKKMSLDFYDAFAEQSPEKSTSELELLALETEPTEFESTKREVYIFRSRYGFGELYYDPENWFARAVLLRLPGISLDQYYFTDLFYFLHIWIKTQIETYFLHKQGIIHGDIRSGNIMYNGNIFLCDFGLSRRIGEVTSGKWSEKSTYLHPALGNEPPPLAEPGFDIFSLGKLIETFDIYHELYNTFKIRKPLATTLLKDIVAGMTNLDPKKQWTLLEAIEQSIDLYNSLQADPVRRISKKLKDYKPSSIPLNFPRISAKKRMIPADALLPVDLSDQFF
jgi:serine/threonine protein kinase